MKEAAGVKEDPRHWRRHGWFCMAALCLTTLFTSREALSQRRYLLEETRIDPGKAQSFPQAQDDYCAGVLRGGAPECIVLAPTVFSPPNLFFTLLRFSSFEHYDEGTYTSRGMTPQQAADLRSRREPAIRENTEMAIELHEQVSFTSPGPGALVRIVEFTIRPGTLPQLYRYVRGVELPAAHKAGMRSSELYQVVAGGETNRFLLLQRFDRFTQLDAVAPFGDIAAPSGTPGSIDGCVQSTRTIVMRVQSQQEAKP